ncbi:actin-associated protein FAM107A [Alosa sapidissima]|uniref:actin-associated protein FAM107A n=1 Tax=Alosa sapidissima TaxID=34773 RepID=UPI001C08D539|nr:actin-associated protein FAM107A [Alosa sapidissima]
MGVTHGKKTDHDLPYSCSSYGKPLSRPVPRPGPDSGRESSRIQRDRALELPGRASPSLSTHSHSSEPGQEALIQPKKLVNPVKVSRSHQALHRELLLSHRRPVAEEKPELQRVLEHRRRQLQIRQRREEEQKRRTSPLEQELHKRQQKLDMLERELDNQRVLAASEPEFIRVKDSLRRSTSLV